MSIKQYKKRYRKNTSFTRLRTVIDPEAAQAYLAKTQNKNWNWIKRETPTELFDRIKWPKKFEFYTHPFKHQAQCFYLGVKQSSFLFYLDMGGGKTKIMLDLFRYRKERGQVNRMLVIVQDVIATDTWAAEIKKHAPNLKFVQIVGLADDRFEVIKQDYDVALVNYHGLQVLLCDWQKEKDKKLKTKREFKRTINQNLVDNFKDNHEMIVLDEIQVVTATGTSLNYDLCRHLTDNAKYCYGLTGTPFGRDPFPVYFQYRLIDAGETFGETPSMFRAVFYKRIRKPWAVEYKFDQRMATDFNQMMLARSIRFDEQEFSDMPPINYNTITVRKHEDIEPYLEKLREEIDDMRLSKDYTASLSTIFYRARALTAGYASAIIKDKYGEKVDKITAYFKTAPKVEALVDKILELPESKKVVVFHVYIESGNMLVRALRKEKIKVAHLRGNTAQRREALDAFREDDAQVLVTSVAIGGTGLNDLDKVCNYVMFFETPSDPKARKQAEKRVHRGAQQHKVFVYDFVMKGTIDEKIVEQLQSGRDFFTMLMEGKKKGAIL